MRKKYKQKTLSAENNVFEQNASDTQNIYISSKNLLILTTRNRCNSRYTKFT